MQRASTSSRSPYPKRPALHSGYKGANSVCDHDSNGIRDLRSESAATHDVHGPSSDTYELDACERPGPVAHGAVSQVTFESTQAKCVSHGQQPEKKNTTNVAAYPTSRAPSAFPLSGGKEGGGAQAGGGRAPGAIAAGGGEGGGGGGEGGGGGGGACRAGGGDQQTGCR